jgi:hypothetical protein
MERPCEITSHQQYIEGIFHGWTKDMKAIVEDRKGTVSVYPMGEIYTLRFKDREKIAE